MPFVAIAESIQKTNEKDTKMIYAFTKEQLRYMLLEIFGIPKNNYENEMVTNTTLLEIFNKLF